MTSIAQFWLVVLSLLAAVGAFVYLFVSFLFPGAAFVSDEPTVRLVATLVGVTAAATGAWAAAFVNPPVRTEPGQP